MATATANDIIHRAARRITMVAANEALTATDGVDALQIMNDMMQGFESEGIAYVHTDLAATDVVNMPDGMLRNLTLMLARDLADNFEITIGPNTLGAIMLAKQALQAWYFVPPRAVVDHAIRPRRIGRFDFLRGG